MRGVASKCARNRDRALFSALVENENEPIGLVASVYVRLCGSWCIIIMCGIRLVKCFSFVFAYVAPKKKQKIKQQQMKNAKLIFGSSVLRLNLSNTYGFDEPIVHNVFFFVVF